MNNKPLFRSYDHSHSQTLTTGTRKDLLTGQTLTTSAYLGIPPLGKRKGVRRVEEGRKGGEGGGEGGVGVEEDDGYLSA